MPEPMLILTSAGTILSANNSTLKLFQSGGDDLINSQLQDHVADHPSLLLQYLASCASTPSPVVGHWDLRTSSDEIIRCRAEGHLLHPASDGMESFIAVRLSVLGSSVTDFVESVHDVEDRRKREWSRRFSEPELHRTKEQLLHAERQYQSLVEAARDAIFTVDTDGKIASLNRVFEDLTGWQRTDWIGKHFGPLLHPDDLETAMGFFGSVLRGESPPAHELRVITRSGEIRCGEFTTTPRWNDGKIDGLIGIARDVTARRQVEKALRESERKLGEAQKLAHLGSWEWDIASNAVTWSDELYRIYGFNPGEIQVTYETFLNLIHPGDRSRMHETVAHSLNSFRSFSIDHRIVHPDGSERILHGEGEVVVDPSGNPIRMIGTAQDITERHRAEWSIRQQAALLDLALDPIIVREIDNNRISFWNSAAEQMYGWRKVEAIGESSHLLLRTHFPSSPDEIERVLYDTGRWEGELTHLHRNGHRLVVAARWALQKGSDGRPKSVLEINRDITVQKEADGILRRSRDELERMVHKRTEAVRVAYAVLQESEVRFRTLIENSSDAIAIVDSEGVIIYASASTARVLGYRPDEIIGLNGVDLVHADERDLALKTLGKVLETPGENVSSQFRVPHRDGSWRWVESDTTNQLHLPAIKGIVVNYRDITERKNAEVSLHTANERLRLLLEIAGILLQSADVREVIDGVCGKLSDHLGLDLYLLYLGREEENAGLSLAAFGGFDAEIVRTIPITLLGNLSSPSFTGKQRSTVHQNVQASEDQKLEIFRSMGITAFTCNSLEVQGRLLGAIVFGTRGRKEIKSDELAFLQTVSDQIATAIHRHRTADRIRRSLREKEILLKEVHHRVKNNLQVVTSLLRLQAQRAADPWLAEVLSESRDRIRSMALIHEKLYQTEDLSRIPFREYAQSLITKLFNTYGASEDRIRFSIDIPDESMNVDTAIPCGLIINELVTNALKYAFPSGRTGQVSVGLELGRNGTYSLRIADDGVGLPQGLDLRQTTTLGLQLVHTLVEELRGTLTHPSTNGTEYRIVFRELRYKERN